jgi:hypothetical protein
MFIKQLRVTFFAILMGLFSMAAVAETPAKTIAGIVSELNHFPNDGQKATLSEIASDTANSEAIRAIAKAVHDMQHAASDADKTRLQAIAADQSASSAERTLAQVVAGMNHMASADAKAQLAAIE